VFPTNVNTQVVFYYSVNILTPCTCTKFVVLNVGNPACNFAPSKCWVLRARKVQWPNTVYHGNIIQQDRHKYKLVPSHPNMPLTPQLSDGLVTSKIFPSPPPHTPPQHTHSLKTFATLGSDKTSHSIFMWTVETDPLLPIPTGVNRKKRRTHVPV
jgi:hypothetical protein